MFQHLLDLLNAFNAYAKLNPILSGIIGLATAGLITAIFIRTPKHIWSFIVRQFTTTLTINNSSVGNNLENFASFLRWFQQNRCVRFSRSFAVDGIWTGTPNNREGTFFGAGSGTHFFVWGGRLFWLSREDAPAPSHNGTPMTTIRITMLGRSHAVLYAFYEAFRYRPPADKLGIYRFDGGDWVRVADVNPRPLRTVIINQAIKSELVEDLTWFRANRKWYESRGRAYKRTYVLYGPPGTGKTSVIKAVASEFNYNLCLINLTRMTDDSLESAIASAPSNSLIAIEDFDSSDAVKARKGMELVKPVAQKPAALVPAPKGSLTPAPKSRRQASEESNSDGTFSFSLGGLTLTGLLNTLDGLLCIDGKVIFMTTNKLETVDSALVRNGRVDAMFEIAELTDTEIREYISLVFPDEAPDLMPSLTFAPILGCDLQALFDRNRDQPQQFIASIPATPLARLA